jgi:[amino group carrier protein]-lysine/ornithine hydrolase
MTGPTDGQAIELLTQMVRIYSPSTQEQEIAQLLVTSMKSLGFEASIDGAGNAVGHWGLGEQRIVLLGHMDTAPGYIEPHREGRLLHGRGTVDAKGPLAAFIMGTARAGALNNTRVTVIGVVEEEARSSKGARYALEQYHPDAVVIGEPSNWDRVTLGYKGSLHLEYVLERPEAHSASQEGTVCEEAVAFWLRLSQWTQEYNRGKTGRFETVDPSLGAMCSRSDGLVARSEMDIRLRLPLSLTVDDLIQASKSWAGTARVTADAYEAPFRADKRNRLVAAFVAAIRDEGGKAAFVSKTGTSDMNIVGPGWGCPILAYGPGDSALDHTPGEHVDLDEYLRAIRVISRALWELNSV